MELPQTGGCQCGGVRYEITEAPVMVYTCHCTDCQRMTSSAFSLGCVLPDGAFRLVQGEPKGVQRTTGSGRVSTRWVCPECGVWVCTAPRPGATVRNVRGGTLDDTSWLRPTAHIWTRSKQPWLSPVAPGSGSCRLTRRQAQARQKQLALLGIPQKAGVRYYDRGYGAQPRDNLSRVVEPTHMGVAGGEHAIRRREAWILLDRKEQIRQGLIKAPAGEMR